MIVFRIKEQHKYAMHAMRAALHKVWNVKYYYA